MDIDFFLCNKGIEFLPVYKDMNKLVDGYQPKLSPCPSAVLHCLYNIYSSKFYLPALFRNTILDFGFLSSLMCVTE
jgi:hypothetical protein